MVDSRGIEYPYDSAEAVVNIGLKLGEICAACQAGAVIYGRSPILKKRGEDYGVGLPGSIEVIENSLVYVPDKGIPFRTLTSSAFLFIRALQSTGAARVVIYMPASPLVSGMTPVVAISDHIDMLSRPPHVGVEPMGSEERFFPMNDAYNIDAALRALKHAGLPETSGVLIGVGIGQLDTPAGRSAALRMGANLMSVHIFGECLIAKRAGMEVVGFAETARVDPETIGGLISAALG